MISFVSAPTNYLKYCEATPAGYPGMVKGEYCMCREPHIYCILLLHSLFLSLGSQIELWNSV